MHHPPLIPGNFYYIYGHTISHNKAFLTERNYKFFIHQFTNRFLPSAQVCAFVLAPSQYHFLLRIKETSTNLGSSNIVQCPGRFAGKQFGLVILSYTNAFNKETARCGPLFIKPFRRKLIKSTRHFRAITKKIHMLPVELNLCSHPGDYAFSSYCELTELKPGFVNDKLTFSLYDGRNNFLVHHNHTACYRQSA